MNSDLDTILFVGGLADEVTEIALRDIFCAFGDIRNIELPLDPVTKKHRGFAFIQFLEAEDAKHALFNMDKFKMYQKTIHVNYAKTRKGDQYKPVWLDDMYIQEQMKIYDDDSEQNKHRQTFEENMPEYEEEVAIMKKFKAKEKKRLEQLFLF